MPIQHRAEGEPISTQFTVWASIVPCVIAEAAMKSNSMAASTCRTVVDFVLRDIVSLLNQFSLDFHLGRPAITGSRSWGNSENTSLASLTSRLRFFIGGLLYYNGNGRLCRSGLESATFVSGFPGPQKCQ